MTKEVLFVKNIVLLEHILAILENDFVVRNNLSTRSGFYGLPYEFITLILRKQNVMLFISSSLCANCLNP